MIDKIELRRMALEQLLTLKDANTYPSIEEDEFTMSQLVQILGFSNKECYVKMDELVKSGKWARRLVVIPPSRRPLLAWRLVEIDKKVGGSSNG